MAFRRATLLEFWRDVEEAETAKDGFSPCWNYTGSDAYSGYKAFRCVLAHRAAAVIYTCEIPSKVKQRCGNRHCVRLEHLQISERGFVKHYSENTGRPLATPTVEQPDMIQQVLAARPPSGRYIVADIAKTVGTTQENVRKILRESALYDLISEIRSLIESKQEVRKQPLTGVTI